MIIARDGMPLTPFKSGSERSTSSIVVTKPADLAFVVSLPALKSPSSLLPWSRSHGGYHGKSGSSLSLS